MDHVDKILKQWHRERPDLDVCPMGTLGRLKRLHDELTKELTRVYSAFGLNAANFDVLATLRRSGPPYALSPSALIASTMVTSGTMTNRIDRLKDAGLVERRKNPLDGRSFVIALTEKGFTLIDRAVTAHVENQHRLVASMDEADLKTLDLILRSWLGCFEEEKAS